MKLCTYTLDGQTRTGIVVDGHGGGHDAVVETVYCLGNCALGPSALSDGELIGRVDADRVAALCGGRQ